MRSRDVGLRARGGRRDPPPVGDPGSGADAVTHERVPIGSVHEDPANVRRHPDRNVAAVKASLARFGQQRPILVGPTGVVIAGNCTLAAARALGWSEIDVVRTDLVGAEAVAYAIADNRTAELAEFDEPALLAQIEELPLDLQEASGWELPEIEELRLDVEGPAEVEEDEAPEPLPDAKAQRGNIITLGRHRVMCGDSTCAEDVARLMGGERVGLVFTSPPYNQKLDTFRPSGMHKETRWADNARDGSYPDSKPEDEYQAWQIGLLKSLCDVLTPDGSLFYNHKNRYRDKQVVSPWRWIDMAGAKVRQEIIWKREGSVTQNARMFMPCDERIFWIYFGDDFYFDDTTEHKTWSSVWAVTSHKDRDGSEHGCAFPVELPARAIRACLPQDGSVYDPFLGSGTTLIAADQLGRRCFGLELEPRYCDVIVRRWLAYCAKAGRAPEVTGWRGS